MSDWANFGGGGDNNKQGSGKVMRKDGEETWNGYWHVYLKPARLGTSKWLKAMSSKCSSYTCSLNVCFML